MGKHEKPRKWRPTGRQAWLLIQILFWISNHLDDR